MPNAHDQSIEYPHLARVASITVTFNPEPTRLITQLLALKHQVDFLIIVDNASDSPALQHILQEPTLAALQDKQRILPIQLSENSGLAKGFNLGIARAQQLQVDFVLLLDQDSIPAPMMVEDLLETHAAASKAADGAIAAVGPQIEDDRDARPYPFIRFGWLRNDHIYPQSSSSGPIECDFLISSGSLIPIDALSAVGLLEDDLFIDSVDLEWCCRAKFRNLKLFGSSKATLNHQLGGRRHSMPGGFTIITHPPLRLYYMTRNRVLLYQRAYIPLQWKIKDVMRMCVKFLISVTLIDPRLENFRMSIRGVYHALFRKKQLPRPPSS